MLDPALKHYIETEILPRYTTFDKAHRLDHVRTVIARSLALATRYGADEAMAYTVAAYHDTGLAVERARHHLISGEILAGDLHLRQWFTEEQIAAMRAAVEDHRASSAHAPRSLYGRIVAEADRQIDPPTIVRRTIQYGLAHYPTLDRAGHYARMCAHLTEKYGEGGYLRLWLNEPENRARLTELRALIDDTQRLRSLFDRIYDEERNAE